MKRFARVRAFNLKTALESGSFNFMLTARGKISLIWWRSLVALMLVGLPIAVAFLSTSCSTTLSQPVLSPPEIQGATFVGNKTCAECHTNYTRMFASSPHSRFHLSGAQAVA